MAAARRILAVILLTIMTVGLAHAPSIPNEQTYCTEQDYIIFAAALDELFGHQYYAEIPLIDETSTDIAAGIVGMAGMNDNRQLFFKDVPTEAYDEFKSNNKYPLLIAWNKIPNKHPTTLITPGEAKISYEQGGTTWEMFYKKHPISPGVVSISRPGLNHDRTKALIYVGRSCGFECGEGYLMLLAKRDESWVVVNKTMTWIS